MRACTSPQVALERLIPELADQVLCFRGKRGGWEIHVMADLSLDPLVKARAIEALAWLADVAMTRADGEEIRQRVCWEGLIPSRGLPAWMEGALRWLRDGRLSTKNGGK
jgi:hypothetical protein